MSGFRVETSRPSTRWWTPFLAGAATGLAAGVVLGVRCRVAGDDSGEDARSARPRPSDEGWATRAWDEAVEGLERAREWLAGVEVPDLAALERRIAALPGGELVRVRDLGDGIVEVVGSAPDEATARTLLDAAGAEPGVEVVVNRVWTPSSVVHNVPGL